MVSVAASDQASLRSLLLLSIGRASMKCHLPSAAAFFYTRLLAREPENTSALIGRGISYAVRRKYSKAESDLSKAVLLDPNSKYAHYNLAMVLAYLRRFSSAIESNNAAILLDPSFQPALSNRQVLLDAKQMYETLCSKQN